MLKRFRDSAWLQKLLHNSGWMILAQGARVLDILVRSIIVARLLSLDDFAAYAVALAFVGLITELANLNIGAVVITYGTRYQQENRIDHLKALIKAGYILTFVIFVLAGAIIAAVLSVSYDTFISQPGLYNSIVALGFAAAFNLFDTINKPVLRLINRFKASCFLDIVVLFINVAFVFWFLAVVPSTSANAIYSAAICLIFMGVSGTLVAWRMLATVVPDWWKGGVSILAKERRSLVRMTIGNSLASSIQRVMRKGDVLLLAALAPAGVVGLYDIGKKLAGMVLLVRDAVALAAFPQIAKSIAAKQHDRLGKLILNLFKIGLPASGVVIAFTWISSAFIIKLSFGEKYIEAGVYFVILTIPSLLFVLFFWANALLLSSRRIKVQMFANMAGLVMMMVSGILLVPEWQSVGMAWAVVFGTTTQFGIVGFVAWNILHKSQPSPDMKV